MNTDDFLKKFGRESAILLVKELVEQGATGGTFFADACSLVRYDWLPEETQNWFKKQNLLLLEGENIKVNLVHKNDFKFGAAGCHEIGQYLIFGSPAGQEIDVTQEPTQVARSAFTPHDINSRFPNGAWAQVEIWGNRMHFTVAGGFVAGTGPNARGILVPSDQFVFYWHTPNSWTEGKEERNFYVKQGGLHHFADYGLYSLAKHLKGEIPAK